MKFLKTNSIPSSPLEVENPPAASPNVEEEKEIITIANQLS